MLDSLKLKIATIQRGQFGDIISRIVMGLLLPFSWIYGLIMAIRNMFYDAGMVKAHRLPGKVISIGNLTTGGSGKTPVTLMLAELLKSRGVEFAILTRGYGAAYGHSEIVFNSGKIDQDTIDWMSDEVVMAAQRLPDCWFGVGKDRYRNGVNLNRRNKIGVFLLDDGFQHRQLARDLDIVVIDASNPLGNGAHLPAGSLREGVSSLKRAGMVLLTRTESVKQEAMHALVAEVRQYLPTERIFCLHTILSGLRDLITGENVSVSSIGEKSHWLVSGIGNPRSFEQLMKACDVKFVGHTPFVDHHRYSDTDVESLLKTARRAGCDGMLTTEKDAVKIPRKLVRPGDCLVAEIRFGFLADEDIFIHQIFEVVGVPV
jgi:tetraacyldisaccharide 4'-kinase